MSYRVGTPCIFPTFSFYHYYIQSTFYVQIATKVKKWGKIFKLRFILQSALYSTKLFWVSKSAIYNQHRTFIIQPNNQVLLTKEYVQYSPNLSFLLEIGQSMYIVQVHKSLSEALLFAEHGENMLCTNIQSVLILWVSWCKNKSFWQRFM